jgi:hypothetical protein
MTKSTKSSTSRARAKKARDTRLKRAPKVVAEKVGSVHRKTASKAVSEKARDVNRRTAPKVAAEKARDAYRKNTSKFEEYREAPVPDSIRALAEQRVAQTRQLYDRSKTAFHAILESWEKSLDGVVALNRKFVDITERNINNSFDLAASLVGARNLAEAVELQTAYWRKQWNDLSAQAGEVRALSSKVSATAVEPIRAQLTRMNF